MGWSRNWLSQFRSQSRSPRRSGAIRRKYRGTSRLGLAMTRALILALAAPGAWRRALGAWCRAPGALCRAPGSGRLVAGAWFWAPGAGRLAPRAWCRAHIAPHYFYKEIPNNTKIRGTIQICGANLNCSEAVTTKINRRHSQEPHFYRNVENEKKKQILR